MAVLRGCWQPVTVFCAKKRTGNRGQGFITRPGDQRSTPHEHPLGLGCKMAIFAWLSPTNAEPKSHSRMTLNTKQRNNHLMKPDLSKSGAQRPNHKSPRTVYFEATAPDAKSVCIAGTFNFWHPAATKMVKLEGGRWGKRLTLPPGAYEYRFVMDNQWKADPNCHQSVPNPYGGMNSFLSIAEVPVSSSKKTGFSRRILKPTFSGSLPSPAEELERSHL
ncbi:MAG: hypothetical protein JWM99_3650 [Verrucomicrobiales bacterium]|nr:hypothetical protein [Verrucomicrobiales bacterium]